MVNSYPTGLQPASCYQYQPKTGRLLRKGSFSIGVIERSWLAITLLPSV
jgi:hypothetical protein